MFFEIQLLNETVIKSCSSIALLVKSIILTVNMRIKKVVNAPF